MRAVHRLVIFLAVATPAIVLAAETIRFDTHGGEAWTFELPLMGTFDASACKQVRIETSRGTTAATLIGNRFFADALLQPGENNVAAVCATSGTRSARVSQRWKVMLKDRPKARIRTRIADGRIHLDGGASEAAHATTAPLVRFEWRMRDSNPENVEIVELSQDPQLAGRHIALSAPKIDGEYYVTLRVEDALGRVDESTAVFRVQAGAPELVDLQTEHPRWFDSAVLYGAAPYMFSPPSFAGIEDRLDEISALGATAIWLSPVTAAAPDDFGYAVADQFAIRADFGGEAGLRSLIAKAHALGLRVLVDFVPNHLSQSHRYYIDAERSETRSPYYDWFDRDESGKVTQYFDWSHLKNLNYDDREVRNYITAAAVQFVRDYDIDGFRIDASWAVAQRAPEFWPELRAELKRIDPDIALIAEASAREPYHVAHGFDAAYDWTYNLGQWAWHEAFTPEGELDLAELRDALTNGDRGYPADSLILRFINNNDTGERFITRFGAGRARVAATLLMTLPGIPLVYNGDEIGAAFQPYDEGPPLQWRNNELTEHYRKLIDLRKRVPTLTSRNIRLIATTERDRVLAFLRPGADASRDVLVLLNFSDSEARVRPQDDDAKRTFSRFEASRDPLTERDAPRRWRVPAHGSLILQQRR